MSKKLEGGIQILVLATAAALTALWPLYDRPAPAQEEKAAVAPRAEAGRAARGRVAYRLYCSSCHGPAARGDGPVAPYLKVHPTDLTGLAAKNGGKFPRESVLATIDGRGKPASAHGPSDMPVWGMTFQVEGRDSNVEADVQQRLHDLVAFLETVQKGSDSR